MEGGESIELNPVSADITEDISEQNICKALPLTGVNVALSLMIYMFAIKWKDCHQMIRLDKVSQIQISQAKKSIMYNCKNLCKKSQELTNLKISGGLFVSENMSHENQQLAYKCQQLKSARKIHSSWFSVPVWAPKLWCPKNNFQVFFFQLYFNKKYVEIVINDLTVYLIISKCRRQKTKVQTEDQNNETKRG